MAVGLDLADPEQRAAFYQEMSISGLYQPASRIVLITAEPDTRRRSVRVGGDLNPHVLADTRPSTSERHFHRRFFSGPQWPDLGNFRLAATRCSAKQASRNQFDFRFRIRYEGIALNYSAAREGHEGASLSSSGARNKVTASFTPRGLRVGMTGVQVSAVVHQR
jgi:hypothetical protein